MLFFSFYQRLLRCSFQWQRGVVVIFLCHLSIVSPLYADNQSAMMQAMFAKAFGKKANAPQKSTADLRINNSSYNQEIEVYSNEQKEIDRADSAVLLIVLNDALTEAFFQTIQKTLETHKKITFSQLSAIGIQTSYNSTNLSLDIEIKPDLQKPRILTLYQKINTKLPVSKSLKASELGGYLNLYSKLTTSSLSEEIDLNLRLEGSLTVNNYVLESTANKNNDQWTLGNTTLIHDRPDKLYRYQAGHIATPTKGFQDNYSLTGINLTKNFYMDSNLSIQPKANATFTLNTKSDIEIYVNGTLQKQLELAAGKYSLEDIGLLDGANNIEIRIKDSFGKVTYKKIRQYYDSQLLKPELSTFTSSLGILKDTQEEANLSLVKQLIFSGYYQQGLYKALTLGIDLQFSSARTLIGTEIITSNTAGRFNINLGLSSRKNGKIGEAARFIYHPTTNNHQTKIKLDRFIRSISFRGEYRSQYFDLLTTPSTTSSSPLQAKLQSNIAFNLGKEWGASIIYGFSNSHKGETEHFANANLSKHFSQGIRWNISANYQSAELQLQTQISIPLSRKLFARKQDINLRYNEQSKQLVTVYNLHRLGSLGNNSLEGQIKQTHTPNDEETSAEVHYRTHQFETHIDAQRNTLSQRLNIGINTSLLCADSTCSFSYPINDSFALVKGPANQNKPIAIKNDYGKFHYPDDSDSELPDNYNALIKNKNSPAVVLLQAYKYQRISIDEGGLPFGYDPEKTEFEFIPRYHSSYTLIAGGKSGTVVTGTLVNQKKEGMGFKGGQWVSTKEGGKIIAFFTNKTGRFHLASVPSGDYQIELFDHPTMKKIQVSIPDKQGEIYSLGKISIIEN